MKLPSKVESATVKIKQGLVHRETKKESGCQTDGVGDEWSIQLALGAGPSLQVKLVVDSLQYR